MEKKILVLLHSIMFRIYGLGLRASEDKQATCTGYIRYCVCMEKVICPYVSYHVTGQVTILEAPLTLAW